jgi:ATP-dependent DNA ligase
MKPKGKSTPLGDAGLFAPASLGDPDLQSLLANYKRTVASRYTALDLERANKLLAGSPYLVSPKVDGELWFLIIEKKDASLVAPNGRVITGPLPLLDEVRKIASSKTRGLTILAGELFAIPKSGRPRVGGLSAAMAGGKSAETRRICFHAFDVVQGGDKDTPEPAPEYAGRLEVLQRLLDGGKHAKAARTETCEDKAAVNALYDEWVEGGKAEGLVIRADDGRTFKLKPQITIDAAIIGFNERSEDSTQVRSMLLALLREDGQFQIIGSCGNLGSDKDRRKMHKLLSPTLAESTYRYASSSGAMYRFVRPETVIEITCTDLQAETASGEPIRQMVLAFDEAWRAVCPLPGASLIHPIFSRIRDDKSVNPTDIRAAQVEERCIVAGLDEAAAPLELPASEILRREVYTKTAKEKTAVRKFLVWKTNKEDTGNFPPYVVHYTDYSPGRKNPLAREVRLANNKKNATRIADELIAANIKGGWEKQ